MIKKIDILQNICEIRNREIERLARDGFSAPDIARYFEMRPKYVEKIVAKIQTPDVKNDWNALCEKREELEGLSIEELYTKGFYFLPANHKIAKAETKPFEPESQDAAYMFIFQAADAITLRSKKKMASILPSYDFHAISERGLQYRKSLWRQTTAELLASGFQGEDIAKYIGISIKDSRDIIHEVKEKYQLDSYPDSVKVYELIKKGYRIQDIAKYFGVSDATITAYHKAAPPDSNHAYRREKIWELYMSGNTQAEIATRLNLNRATINNDIKQYKKEHNIERMRVKWRDDSYLPLTDELKEQAIKRLDGVKTIDIVNQLKVREGSLQRFIEIEEHTAGTALYENRIKLESAIEKGLAEGKSSTEIAKEIGKTYQYVITYIKKRK